MKNMQQIIEDHERLERDLRVALATLERKSIIYDIRMQILDNQRQCPHFSPDYNWAVVDEICPYCGKELKNL